MSSSSLSRIRSLNSGSSHADVRTRVNNYLEDVLDWTLKSESGVTGGSIDTVPLTEVGDREVETPAFVVEYKSDESEDHKELESKSGGQTGETAIEQLVRYVTTTRVCNYGLLCDASRLVVYERIGDGLNDEPIHEVVFDSASRSDFIELDNLIPLFKGQPGQLQITNIEDFVDILEDSISLLIDPLESLYDTIQPDEYELLLEIIPSGISKDEFIQKTAASVVSKILLLRALEDQNDQFGIVLNPEVIQSFAKSEYGYLLAYSSAYDLGGMKFPQVFKADIDVFDWWEPRELTSYARSDARDAHLQMNNRLTNVLERLYRYEVEFGADLMGLTYQRLRKKGETSVLGAYYTPPALTNTTVQAVETVVSDLDITDYDLYNLYEDPDFRMIDPTCGSGTFLLTYARKAMEYSDRADSDAANQIIRKTHGIDVDPLAVLMARAQIYGTLSGYLDAPPSPNIYWTDSLEHVRKYGADRSLMEFMNDYDQIQPPIDEVRYDINRAQEKITDSSFDLVVGNPPWGRRAEIVRHLTEAGVGNDEAEERVAGLVPSDWEDMFDERDANLLTSFFKASDQLLKDSGIVALVLDARFQASGWGEKVIDTLNDYQEVRVLDASLSRKAEFPESASYPAIVLGVK
jgi:hypothetical protein